MKSGWIALALVSGTLLVPAGMVWARGRQARADYVQQVEKLRRISRPLRQRDGTALEDARWKAKLHTLDRELDTLFRADSGIGAGWMWTPQRRPELESVIDSARPVLADLVALAHDRKGMRVHICPRLLWSRHRTNLLCAAAIVTDDPDVSLQFLSDALEVAAIEDDGSLIAGMVRTANVSIVADAAARVAATSDRVCELLSSRLLPQFAPFIERRDWELRLADFAIQSVDGGWAFDYEPRDLRLSTAELRNVEARILQPSAAPILGDVVGLPSQLQLVWRPWNAETSKLLHPTQ